MDELQRNPDGCQRFEPNQFKREKCKNCGHPWQLHAGVIDKVIVDGFAGAKRKLTEERLQKEAEAKAKIKAKAVAKKKASQAVEDQWFNDGVSGEVEADESDDDQGFKMFFGDELGSAPIENRQRRMSESSKTLKVKNLIDFGECDVPEEPLPEPPALQPLPSAQPALEIPSSVAAPLPNLVPAGLGLSSSGAVEDCGSMADMLGEIEHLRHMLRNANEEKTIHLAIVQDEVTEKQQIIEDMKRQRMEDQAEITNLRRQVEGNAAELQQAVAAAALAAAPPDNSEQIRTLQHQLAETHADIDVLRQQMAEKGAELDRCKALVASASSQAEELSQLRVEVEELRRAREAPPPPSPALLPPAVADSIIEVHGLCARVCQCLADDMVRDHPEAFSSRLVQDAPEDAMRRLGELAKSVEVAAQRSTTERRRLEIRLADAEASAAISANATAGAAAPVTQAVPPLPLMESQVINRQAAKALREVRLNAEQQLAWISKRIKIGRQADLGQVATVC